MSECYDFIYLFKVSTVIITNVSFKLISDCCNFLSECYDFIYLFKVSTVIITNVSFKLVSVLWLVNLLSSWSFYCVLEKLTSLFLGSRLSSESDMSLCQILQYSHRQYSQTGLICQQQQCNSLCHKLSVFFNQTETETKCIHTQTKDKALSKAKPCSLLFFI